MGRLTIVTSVPVQLYLWRRNGERRLKHPQVQRLFNRCGELLRYSRQLPALAYGQRYSVKVRHSQRHRSFVAKLCQRLVHHARHAAVD